MRQRSYAATRLLRGFEVRTPFLARPWVDFMLGVPEWFRGDQLLYRETQKFAYPGSSRCPPPAMAAVRRASPGSPGPRVTCAAAP